MAEVYRFPGMKYICLLISITVALSASAQENSLKTTDYPASHITRKNSLDLVVYRNFGMALRHTRYFNKWDVQTTLGIQQTTGNNSMPFMREMDSSRQFWVEPFDMNALTTLKIGIGKTKNFFSFHLNASVGLRQYKGSYQYNAYRYTYDTLGQRYLYYNNQNQLSDRPDKSAAQLITTGYENRTDLSIGLSPTLEMYYVIAEKFKISIMMLGDITYETNLTNKPVDSFYYYNRVPVSTLNFNLNFALSAGYIFGKTR